MIALEDVCCAFDHEPVLRHISFTIKKGEAVLLTGPNGSGKTTLLRLLNGLVFPELGTYTFEGTAITAKKMREHRYSKYFHQRVEDAIAYFSLEKLRDKAPYFLSGGEKKRTALASIFTMNPAVWTLDEPENFLDAESQTWLTQFLQSLKDAGKTIIVTSHHPDIASRIADRELRLTAEHQLG